MGRRLFYPFLNGQVEHYGCLASCRPRLFYPCFQSVNATISSYRISQPYIISNSSFNRKSSSTSIEEENFPTTWLSDAIRFALGKSSDPSTYQVAAKLGYGSSSKMWLCRNIRYFSQRSSQPTPPTTYSARYQKWRS